MTLSQAMPAAPDRPPTAARQHVRQVVAASGSSFQAGMRLLPTARRDAIYALYAFCREVDDIADGPLPTDQRLRDLDGWRAEIDRLYRGQPSHPVTVALAPGVRAYALPQGEFLAVLDGMAMDARETLRAPPMADLELYCRRVAGAVGLLSVRIFGAAGGSADGFAVALGHAFQLTNILRDIDEDAQRGRLYLPRELLATHRVPYAPDAALAHDDLQSVCRELAERAQGRFAEAERALPGDGATVLRPALAMQAVYRRLLQRMIARGWCPPRERVRLSRAEKLWLALRYGLPQPPWRRST